MWVHIWHTRPYMSLTFLLMVVSEGSWYVILRYLNSIWRVGASPAVHGRLSSKIQAEKIRINPLYVTMTSGFSSPSFKKAFIISTLRFRLTCSSLVGPSSFLASLAPLHSVMCPARFCSFGSLGSISNVISVPSTVLGKLRVLFDLV